MNTEHPSPAARWPWLVFGILAAASAGLGLAGLSWAGWRPASCLPADCFCEAIRAGPVAQPVNAYSNLAFVLAGLLIVGRRRPDNAFDARPAYARVYSAALVVIGLGSLFYHATLTFAGQWFDVMGMYLLATFLAGYDLARLRPIGGRAFAAGYALVNLGLGILLIAVPDIRRAVFAGLIVAVIGLEAALRRRRPGRPARDFALALVIFAAAYGIWILDNARLVCWPDSLLQGHAVWHILGALAAWLMARHFRSEPRPVSPECR